MVVFIKNMVCDRCISTVERILKRSRIPFSKVMLGQADLKDKPDADKMILLSEALKEAGFELIDNRRAVIIGKIKNTVIRYLAELESPGRPNLSAFISAALNYEYSYLSNLFSSVEGLTIEQFFILQRIEKAKELLVYDQLSVSEIAEILGYSSVHHLSGQFRKITGLSPSHFKKLGHSKRKPIDTI